jgi:hypothetical protein
MKHPADIVTYFHICPVHLAIDYPTMQLDSPCSFSKTSSQQVFHLDFLLQEILAMLMEIRRRELTIMAGGMHEPGSNFMRLDILEMLH